MALLRSGPVRGGSSGHAREQAVRRCRGERGASAVEFAIILPLLILLVFGIAEFSIAYNRAQGIHAASREGSRIAALPQTTQEEIDTRVRDLLEGVLPDTSLVSVDITPDVERPCNLRAGETVTVDVSFDHDIEIPLWGQQTVTLTGTGEFRCE